MKIKTATLIGLIGAITSLVIFLYFLAYNTGIISFFVDTFDFFPLNLVDTYSPFLSSFGSLISKITLCIFFYVVYKHQK